MAKKNAIDPSGGDNKRSIFSRFRKKKPSTAVSEQTATVHLNSVIAPKVQIPLHKLSYEGRHLVLLIQHHVDLQHIKVPQQKPDWDGLVDCNQSVDLIEKAEVIMDLCTLDYFDSDELDRIAKRVWKLVSVYQPENVLMNVIA